MILYEHELQNAYIGEVWTPTSNTLLYLPMQTDLLDKVGTYTVTNTSVTLTTLSGVKCWYFNGSARLDTTAPSFANKNHTISIWYKDNWSPNNYPIISSNTPAITTWECFRYSSSTNLQYVVFSSSSSITNISPVTKSNWNNIVFSWWNIYVNWTLMGTTNPTYVTWYNFTVWWHAVWWSSWFQYITWYMSEVIIEDSVRTSEQAAAYYNQTKSKFWL